MNIFPDIQVFVGHEKVILMQIHVTSNKLDNDSWRVNINFAFVLAITRRVLKK